MKYEYIDEYSRLEVCIDKLFSKPKQWLGCDTETGGLDCHSHPLSLIQIATEDKVYILDILRLPKWPAYFKKLVEDGSFIWAFHNFKFDLKFFWKNGVCFFGNKVFDTMIASSLLTAGLNLENDLNSVSERYLELHVDKEEQKSDWLQRPLSQEQLKYAARDAHTTLLLARHLVDLIKNNGVLDVFRLEMRVLYSFASMEYYGMNLDLARLQTLQPIYEERLDEACMNFLDIVPGRFTRKDIFGKYIDYGLELKSSIQVLSVLRNFGIPNPLYDPKGKTEELLDPLITSTGSNVLKLLDITEYPLIEYLLNYRKASKLLDAYVYSLPKLVNPITNRLHPNFRQAVSTGRASCSNPNMQQLPRPDGSDLNLRSCFIPTEGYEMHDADYCLAEGTRVSTERGTIPIEYVQKGDRVYQDTNSTEQVLRVVHKGELPVKEIVSKYGYRITATDEHRFRVLDNGEYIWKHVSDLKLTDHICITAGRASDIQLPVKMPEINYQHANEKTIQFPSHLNAELALFLGYMAGDGSYTSKGISWVVCDKDPEVFTALNSYAVKAFGRIGSQSAYRGVLEAAISSVPLVRLLGFIGASKTSVPDSLYRSPLNVIQAYLRGLFEADGSVCDRVTVSSTSESYIQEIQQLLLICGIISVHSKPKMSKLATKQLHILSIPASFTQSYLATIGFMSDRKINKLKELATKTNYSPTIGNIPIPRDVLKAANLTSTEKYILRNSINLDRPVSLLTAAEFYTHSPVKAIELELHRPIMYNQYFIPIASIEDKGVANCYDLEVERTHTYISNGFVSHNSQIELRVVAEIIYQLSGDRKMLDEFIEGKDPYAATAALLSGMKYEDIVDNTHTILKQYKTLRQNAKAVRLGYNYCLDGETSVPTTRGVVPIKDIKIGDLVLTHTGTYKEVTDTQAVYTQSIIDVRTSTGKYLRMTPDHKMLTILPRSNKQLENTYEWIDAENLKVGDYLVPNNAEYLMPSTPYFSSIEHARITGWFLSEGTYSNGLFYIAQCPVANPVIFQEMIKVLEPLGFFRYDSAPDRFYIHSSDRKRLLKSIDIDWKLKSNYKTFEGIRELLNKQERLSLLAALWDGDGCVCVSNNKLSITYHSLSTALILDIKYLLDSLGLNSRIITRQSGLNELRIIGTRSMRLFIDIIPTTKVLKATKLNLKRKAMSQLKTEERIISITSVDATDYPMYDITVKDDHSFIANGLVSHNCMGAKKFKSYAKITYGVSFTQAEADANRALYFAAYPGLGVYHETFQSRDTRVVHTLPPFNRPRYFDDYPGIPALSNHPVQGCLNYKTSKVKTNLGYLSIEQIEKDTPTAVWTGTEWSDFKVVNRGQALLAKLHLKNSVTLDCDVRHEVLSFTEEGYQFKSFSDLSTGDVVCTSIAEPLDYGIDYSTEYLEF